MIRTLRLRLINAFILFVLLCISCEVKATHSMGADLTYECLGGNTYKLRLSFYRDCIGIAAPNNVYININSASCGISTGITAYPIAGTGQEITPICPSATSTCNGGTFTGIQEWVYEGTVTLPFQCTDWTFSYRLCCRNGAITTINSPLTQYIYIYSTLNNTVTPCNNSPTFTNKPVPFVCQGQQFCFNHGASDTDGDSLAYSLITPLHDAGIPVTYLAPYSATQPLNSVPAMSFDQATGDFCITPQTLQVTVMAVLVSEYRNGVLIGTVERDIQITVLQCNNNLPTLTGINGTNNFSATICAGAPFCFNIFSNDPDVGQNVSLSWDQAIQGGATFTSAGSPHPTGTFCWTPLQSDISSTPHCFTVRVHDDACPYMGSQVYSYCLTVVGVNVNAGPDQYITCSDLATITATASGGSGTYTYLWSNGWTNPTQTVGVGTYIVTVNDGMCTATDTVQVIPLSMPIAAFNATSLCINSPVHFTDLSSVSGSTIINWNWTFGDGSTSTQQNPIHQYATAGTYTACLTVTTDLGCVDSICQPVTIYPIPVAGFNISNVCAGASVTITNTSTPQGNINGFFWTLGNGQTSTLQNPTVSYPNAGTYTIILIAGDTLGCADTATQQITIYPSPIAGFNFTGSNACQNGPMTFTDNSTGNIVSWNWGFGNGQTSTQQNPTITYTSAGTYDVTLIVTSANGCVDSITQTITVAGPPTANAGPPQSICQGQSATLSATGGVTYQWSGGLSGANPTVNPTTTTIYTVTVTDANGCTASAQTTVTVLPLPQITASPNQSICDGQTISLSANGATSYSWTPTGDITQTITITPTVSTTYSVTGTDNNGCQNTAFVNITVHNLPVVNIPNTFVCSGSTALLDAGNSGSTYLWSNGQTTQTISVTQPASFTVTVTNQWGCSAIAQVQVASGGSISNNPANVAFCQGGSAVLDAGNPGNIYSWAPGGQTTQTITVTNSGQYNVTITNANGCSATITTTVNINPIPVPDFTPNSACVGQAMNFLDISSIASGSITQWFWDFGDGNVSMQQNPTHIYASASIYTVSLTVTSASGCVATISKNIQAVPLPAPNFTSSGSCLGSGVQFANTSTTSSGNIINWNWHFGDGSNSSSQNPSHNYSASGTFPVQLIVTTSGGCIDSITQQVTVFPLPQADFSATTVCKGISTDFTDLSTVAGNNISSWHWDYGDGNTSTQQNPSHIYANSGNYIVYLIVATANGCSDTITHTVTVRALPLADAGTNQSVCLGQPATLTATGGLNYIWAPSGQTTSTIIVSPLVNSIYTVTVTDANGCTNTDSVRVNIRSLPVANAGLDKQICIGNSVILTATGGTGYQWNPGGYTTATITVSTMLTTSYNVLVTGSNGCTATDTVLIKVNPLPNANAGIDTSICKGTTATLTATGGSSYSWFPTGDTSSTIYISPQNNSSYIVTVTDSNGCRNKDTVQVSVNPVPVVTLNNSFICLGFSTTLNAGNPGANYMWSTGDTTQTISVSSAGVYNVIVTNSAGCAGFAQANVVVGGNGLLNNSGNTLVCLGSSAILNAGNPGNTYLWSTGATTQTISVANAGAYTVTVTDPGGCTAQFVSLLVVNPLPNVSFTATTSCLDNAVPFTNTSSIVPGNILSTLWNFGDGTASSLYSPVHNYISSGNYIVSLIVISGNGCTDTITHPVAVHAMPVANFGSTTACYGSATNFTDLSTITPGSITTWNWNFGDGDSSNTQNPSHIYDVPGQYNVTLIAGTSFGCADTFSYSVTVHPTPMAAFTYNNICQGTAANFTNGSYINSGLIDVYSWNFGDGTTSSLENPQHIYTNAGIYNVSLIASSDMGCADTAQYPITIYAKPVANFSAPTSCLTNAVVFTDNSTVSNSTLSNWYWNFGDNSSANGQNVTHLYNSAGTWTVLLSVTSNQGCADSLFKTIVIAPKPEAGFSLQSICQNSSMQFADTSSVSSGTISSWNWSFGNGNTSTLQNPSSNYPNAGTYPVTLIVTTNMGCRDTITQNVNVFAIPTANFSSSDVCLGTFTPFYNQSSIAGGATYSCTWDFGDGTIDTSQNPTHIYIVAGSYNVTLTVMTNTGCVASTVKQVTIHGNPDARYTANDVCLNQVVTFNDQSIATPGIIVSWNWNFGDGATISTKSPVHQYRAYGTYPVTLDVMSSFGCTDNYIDTVNIYRLPAPQINVTRGCITQPTIMTDTGDTSAASGTNSWQWDFGDGNSTNGASAIHQYATAGTYVVTLTATNASGCRAIVSTPVIVDPAPDAGFSTGPTCVGSAVQFTDTSTILNGTITGWQWYFGDSSAVSNQQYPSHLYTLPGTYTIMLVVTSSYGCTDTIYKQITVHDNPVANFVYSQAKGCGPLSIHFTDSSYINGSNIVAWSWDFGDGGIDSIQNPTHIYTSSGNYPVTLTSTSADGCTNTFTINNAITVYPQPNAAFTPNPYETNILQPLISFENQTTQATIYYWDLGDGTHSSNINPQHAYGDTGTYIVNLTAINQFGCVDTAIREVQILPIWTFYIPNAFTPNNDGTNDIFDIKGIGILEYQLKIWDRWGELIYTSNNRGWDGSVKGLEVKAKKDVYIYQVVFTDVFGKSHDENGRVTLVR